MHERSTLSLQNVYHYYGSRCALEDITFHVREKKITVILGKSGSGKSTLLQIVNGMIRPSEGQVVLMGDVFDYKRADKIRSQMGYAVQGVGLFPHLTVEQNILIPNRIRKAENINPNLRVDDLMSKMNLPSSFRKKYPYELSGGEQQRVGICRALFNNPPILLMDEPLGALDSVTQEDILKEIINLQKTEPRTVLLITHNPYEALFLADDVAILDHGKLMQHDLKQNILKNPTNDLVEKLLRIKSI